MYVFLNAHKIQTDQAISLYHLLLQHGYDQGFYAVAVNRCIIAHHLYPSLSLKEGDEIDIVSPMQGG